MLTAEQADILFNHIPDQKWIRSISLDEILILCDWMEENPHRILALALESTISLLRRDVEETKVGGWNQFTFHVWEIKGYYGIGWSQPRFLVEKGTAPI